MSVSLQTDPTSSMEDGLDGLQALALDEDWSNTLPLSNSLLQMPIGPLDPELAIFDSLLGSDNSQSLNFGSNRESRDDSIGSTLTTPSSKGSSQTSPPDTPSIKSGGFSKTQTAKQRRNTSALLDDGPISGGMLKETTKEKNRLAASKCRKKKKLEEKDLEERRRSLQMHNSILQDTAADLREEVLFLKNEVLKHGTCDFPPIQACVAAAASQLHNFTPDSERDAR